MITSYGMLKQKLVLSGKTRNIHEKWKNFNRNYHFICIIFSTIQNNAKSSFNKDFQYNINFTDIKMDLTYFSSFINNKENNKSLRNHMNYHNTEVPNRFVINFLNLQMRSRL